MVTANGDGSERRDGDRPSAGVADERRGSEGTAGEKIRCEVRVSAPGAGGGGVSARCCRRASALGDGVDEGVVEGGAWVAGREGRTNGAFCAWLCEGFLVRCHGVDWCVAAGGDGARWLSTAPVVGGESVRSVLGWTGKACEGGNVVMSELVNAGASSRPTPSGDTIVVGAEQRRRYGSKTNDCAGGAGEVWHESRGDGDPSHRSCFGFAGNKERFAPNM